jgi:hypothetical protein
MHYVVGEDMTQCEAMCTRFLAAMLAVVAAELLATVKALVVSHAI